MFHVFFSSFGELIVGDLFRVDAAMA
jgi:hypothetical protein